MIPSTTHVREVSRVEHPMSRYLPDVIDLVLGEIPIDEHKELQADLCKLRETALYTPPECMGPLWRGLAYDLNTYLSTEMSSDWEKRIAAIIRNEPVVVVEHPSAWRADWQRRWAAAERWGHSHDLASLCRELVKQIARCPDSEINEVILAAKYAVGE